MQFSTLIKNTYAYNISATEKQDFDLIIYLPSTIFQLCRDGSSWVEPVLS